MKLLKRLNIWLIVLLLPNITLAGGLDKAKSTLQLIYDGLYALAIISASIALLWVGYKVLFGARAVNEFSGIIVGAIVLAGSAELANMFFS